MAPAKPPAVLLAGSSAVCCEGANFLRQRVVLSLLSGKSCRINRIRFNDEHMGLTDYEVCFLKLIDVITNGTKTDINKSGTTVSFVPGSLSGGRHRFACDVGRGLAYYVEPLLALAPFCKQPLHLTLIGVTNCPDDLSVDTLKCAWLPVMRLFLLNDENLQLNVGGLSGSSVSKRGFLPAGGGEVVLTSPICRQLRPVHVTSGKGSKVCRIRGTAFGSRVSPTLLNRMIGAAKEAYGGLLSDVFITTDHRKGHNVASCAGFGVQLRADTTSDSVVYSADAMCQPAGAAPLPSRPEDLGQAAAHLLLNEIYRGGACDSTVQWLVALWMALGPTDVSQFYMGPLANYTVHMLRHIREFFNVTFKIETLDARGRPVDSQNDGDDNDDAEGYGAPAKALLTCVGVGYSNLNKELL